MPFRRRHNRPVVRCAGNENPLAGHQPERIGFFGPVGQPVDPPTASRARQRHVDVKDRWPHGPVIAGDRHAARFHDIIGQASEPIQPARDPFERRPAVTEDGDQRRCHQRQR
jgi:hypothetical protein